MSEKSAHIITDRQKKGALSSVKKPKLPKTVLINNDINFWPCLDENQNENFVKLLETWCEEGVKDGLLIGLESTLRNLKKSDHVQLLVIGNEISPKFFGKHVIATALNKNRNMKIIIIPKLKDLTNRLFKVPAIIFSVLCSTNIQFLDDFYTKLGIHDELLKNYCTIQNSINLPTKKRKERKLCGETNEIKVCLLEKTSTSSRSFIPTSNEKEETSASSPTEIKMDTSDFISFSKDNISSDFLAKSSSAPLYRPLKFMKIAGNPNRKKK